MADAGITGSQPTPRPDRIPTTRFMRLPALPAFQSWAARMPLLRRIVRREGEAMFDLVAGFCYAQILQAIVRLHLPAMLLNHQMTPAAIAQDTSVPLDRMQVLLRGGVALGLMKERRGYYRLTTRGAALAGVPGLQGMIDHHDVLYRDLADPVAFFRGEVETELADFWPYVFGAGGAADPDTAARYSALMADSQGLVAADTLATVSFDTSDQVMDVGGGTGAFLAALGTHVSRPQLTLFDLPAVVPAAQGRFAEAGLQDRARIVAGSFRDDELPTGADTITLVRVLYDHADASVLDLLRKCHAALPSGGQLVISEPMTGGAQPERAGDAYFALYCMAMRTGRARSAQEIAALLAQAGFKQVKAHKPRRPFITSVVTAVR